jgi:membrane fusion protein (multidrug efflux system)
MKRIWLGPLMAAAGCFAGCKRDAAPAGGGPPAASFAAQAVVVTAGVQPVSESLSLVGTVAANEMVEIKSETDGTVEKVFFVEGQPVKTGDLLLLLDETKFAATANEAEANFKLSQANYERSKQLFRDKLISQQEHDQIAAQFQANQAGLDLKRRQLKDARIRAPFEGIISSRSVSPGQVIGKNTTLTWVVDLDPVKVELNVPERYVGRLKIGQKIEVTVAAYPRRTFAGEVFFVAPFVEAATRTALVKAKIPNETHELKPGMFANLELTLQLKEEAIVIPESSVLASGGRNVIYVVDAQDTAQIRPVKLGIRQAGLVEITEGLQPGERVVAEGLQKVRPGGKVKAAAEEKKGERGSGEAGKGAPAAQREGGP